MSNLREFTIRAANDWPSGHTVLVVSTPLSDPEERADVLAAAGVLDGPDVWRLEVELAGRFARLAWRAEESLRHERYFHGCASPLGYRATGEDGVERRVGPLDLPIAGDRLESDEDWRGDWCHIFRQAEETLRAYDNLHLSLMVPTKNKDKWVQRLSTWLLDMADEAQATPAHRASHDVTRVAYPATWPL